MVTFESRGPGVGLPRQILLSEIERLQKRFDNHDTMRLSSCAVSPSAKTVLSAERVWQPAFTLNQLKKLQKAK
jgi:hypothetical protein